jgi:hypothetical protein
MSALQWQNLVTPFVPVNMDKIIKDGLGNTNTWSVAPLI